MFGWEREEAWQRFADEQDLWLALADLRRAVDDLKLYVAHKRIAALELELKYRPDQPRAPAGYREGGQWTLDGAGTPSAHPRRRTGSHHSGGAAAPAKPRSDVGSLANDAAALLGLGHAEAQVRPRGSNFPPIETTMRDVFPGLQTSPGAAILASADALLGLTAPGDAANLAVVQQEFARLRAEIKAIDPTYHYDAVWPPRGLAALTWKERASVLDALRFDLAATKYKVLGQIEPLQVETLRFAQARVDEAYAQAKQDWEAGALTPRLSREEAIGNKVDRDVRRELIGRLHQAGIDPKRDQNVSVNMRVYSRTDSTYRVPDAQLGNASYDWTLTRKTGATPQIQGYFGSRATPKVVIIVRPSDRGGAYAIDAPVEKKSMQRFHRINIPVYIPESFPDLIDFLTGIMSSAPRFEGIVFPEETAENMRTRALLSLDKLAAGMTAQESAEARTLIDQAFALFAKAEGRYSPETLEGFKLIWRVEEILDGAWGRSEGSGLGDGSRA